MKKNAFITFVFQAMYNFSSTTVITLLFLSTLTAASVSVDRIAELRSAFTGQSPFFAISVSRTTKHNEEGDYLPLTSTERFLVLSVLDMFLSGGLNIPGNFDHKLQEKLDGEIRQYQALEETFVARSNISDDAIIGEQPERRQAALRNGSQQSRAAIEKLKEAKTMQTFAKVDRNLLMYWRQNIAKSQGILARYLSLWGELTRQIIRHASFLRNSASSYALVVFNEMFFGKSTPFPLGAIEGEIEDLSSKHPLKIFHVNFLADARLESGDCQNFIQAYKGGNEIFYCGNDGNYDAYFATFQSKVLPLSLLLNVSKTYLNGHPFTYYHKSSYQCEDDESLKNGYFYMFGNSKDAGFPIGSSQHEERQTAEIVLNYLATEICYDLELGLRKNNRYYPPDLKVFVVPSNTLAFNNDKMQNLPDHASLVFHVDPTEQAIFVKTPIISTGLATSTPNLSISDNASSSVSAATATTTRSRIAGEETATSRFSDHMEPIWQKERPIFILQFELEGSLYQIKLWDIAGHLG